jgi:cbb3-type cytochrome oxidase subunit 3
MPFDPPPAAANLLADARSKGSKWDQFDYARTWILDNVVSSGPGAPKSIDAERIQDMIGGSREASPFEIVAAQAMLARWLEIPSRIGYGFDGGELVDGRLQVRPKNGATFVEVYFPGYKWLPVIGTPKQAKPTVGGDPSQQQIDPTILPSEDVSVQLFLPVVVPPGSILLDQIRQTVLIVLPIILLLVLAYILWPALRKARLRSRRRAAAAAAGPRARVALAYAEWRDYATDFGFRHPTDTPLMFLDRFIEDPDHTEFAWLVTRALWGDLQYDITPEMATAAEELSRSLRSRLGQAQPSTVRAVAMVSRLSLRNPYAPETDLTRKKEKTDALAA